MAIPVLGTVVTVLVVVCTAFVCLKKSKTPYFGLENFKRSYKNSGVKCFLERSDVAQNIRDTHDRRNTENQKYYATIHKVGLTNSEKIPGR